MKGRRGLSLVETLVVVAILALLGGIAYAAFGPAREAARRGQCASNLRQLGHAFQMYCEDHGGAEPTVGQALEYYDLGLPPAQGLNYFKARYVNNEQIFYCPSYHGDAPVRQLAMSYAWGPDAPEDGQASRFSQVLFRRGPDTPLLECMEHNAYWRRGEEPRWVTKRVLVLRLDGRVADRIVGVREPASDW